MLSALIWRDLLHYKWLLIFMTALTLLSVAVIVFRWPDQFTASVHLRIVSSERIPFRVDISPHIFKDVVDELDLGTFFSRDANAAADMLRGQTRLTPVVGADQWMLSVTVPSKTMSVRIARSLAQRYIKASLQAAVKAGQVEILREPATKAFFSGPDRFIFLYWAGILPLVIVGGILIARRVILSRSAGDLD
jgi:hypothetical protein